jgi:hypothetical protein
MSTTPAAVEKPEMKNAKGVVGFLIRHLDPRPRMMWYHANGKLAGSYVFETPADLVMEAVGIDPFAPVRNSPSRVRVGNNHLGKLTAITGATVAIRLNDYDYWVDFTLHSAETLFREYHDPDKKEFTDHHIDHDDVQIQIVDDSAVLKRGTEDVLDYHPRVYVGAKETAPEA